MQYCWQREINSSASAELLLVNSESFDSQFGKLTIVILVFNLSVRRTDRSTVLLK